MTLSSGGEKHVQVNVLLRSKCLTVCISSSYRYIGEGYSQAQESMEDEMREFYGLDQNRLTPMSSPTSGQLVAVRAEEEEVLRAQICDVLPDKVKVSSEEQKVIKGEGGISKASIVGSAGLLCGPRLLRGDQQNQSV